MYEYKMIDTHNGPVNGMLDPRGDAYDVVLSIREKIKEYDYIRVFMNAVMGLAVIWIRMIRILRHCRIIPTI